MRPDYTVIAIFVIIFGSLALKQYWRHRERMAMIQKGLSPDAALDPDENVGPGNWSDGSGRGDWEKWEAYWRAHPYHRHNRLNGALITSAVGVAITLGLLTLGIGPWLLGGLVPLFVGLAMLLGLFLSEAPQPRDPASAIGESESPSDAPPSMPPSAADNDGEPGR